LIGVISFTKSLGGTGHKFGSKPVVIIGSCSPVGPVVGVKNEFYEPTAGAVPDMSQSIEKASAK
jgi:hypothetical protein